MTTNSPNGATAAELRCANCQHRLDPTDKFCRECGLPTLHRAHTQRAVPTPPPDTAEFRRAMDVAADPRPFIRETPADEPSGQVTDPPDLTTGSVVRVTNPTQAAQMAASTLLMVGLIVVLAVVGVALLVLAFQQ
jgi:hypothetical protein